MTKSGSSFPYIAEQGPEGVCSADDSSAEHSCLEDRECTGVNSMADRAGGHADDPTPSDLRMPGVPDGLPPMLIVRPCCRGGGRMRSDTRAKRGQWRR